MGPRKGYKKKIKEFIETREDQQIRSLLDKAQVDSEKAKKKKDGKK